jgi:bifunctional polynucleotide phosphatase/kinase
MDFICSLDDDCYRKPRTGLWEFLMLARYPALDLTTSNALYVGDAAGRPAVKKGRKKVINE